jgi:cytochrome P450
VPFAIRMAGEMLGLRLDIGQINSFYAAFARAMLYDGDPEPLRMAETARHELNPILAGELERSRKEASDSITSVVARIPDGLNDKEIIAQLRVILFGAVETVQA